MNGSSSVASTVIRLIAVELNVDENAVRRASSLRQDLSMDSVSAANILFALEEEYGIEISLEELERLDTVPQLEHVVSEALARSAQ